MKKFLIIQILASVLTLPLVAEQSNRADQENDRRFFASADILYWQTNQTGMSYGQIANFHTNIQPAPLTGAEEFFGNQLNVNFKFDPGVRASIGFQPKPDFWKFDFIWTHLNSNASGASNNPDVAKSYVVITSSTYLVPQPLNNNGINASACWSSRYNTFDLDMHKELFANDSVNFQAHAGIRSLWLKQVYNIFSFKTHTEDTPPIFVNTKSNMIQNMWGVGPMIGMSSAFNIYRGLNFFGQACLALMWGHVCSSNIGTILTSTPAVTTNMIASFNTTIPQTSAIIGLLYNVAVRDNYQFCARLGWDFQTLFNVNFLGANYLSAGNFNLSGLTAGLAFNREF
jgi:hypothetical protein